MDSHLWKNNEYTATKLIAAVSAHEFVLLSDLIIQSESPRHTLEHSTKCIGLYVKSTRINQCNIFQPLSCAVEFTHVDDNIFRCESNIKKGFFKA